jgi:Fe-S cluster biogenesis protein NfuA
MVSGSLEERIESVLESVRPALRADHGDIELVEVVGRSARVRLTGACDGCPSAALTLRFGIEKKLREAIPEFEDLIPI